MQITRRNEPYLDDELKQSLESSVLTDYPTRRAAALPVLHAIQDKYGYLPYQAIEEAAGFLDISAAELLDTVTFYEEFRLEPMGKYVIWVCQSLSCELMGEKTVEQIVSDKLCIKPGRTTDDGKFSLMKVECLGSCGTAPCMLINETLYECLDHEKIIQIINSLE